MRGYFNLNFVNKFYFLIMVWKSFGKLVTLSTFVCLTNCVSRCERSGKVNQIRHKDKLVEEGLHHLGAFEEGGCSSWQYK